MQEDEEYTLGKMKNGDSHKPTYSALFFSAMFINDYQGWPWS